MIARFVTAAAIAAAGLAAPVAAQPYQDPANPGEVILQGVIDSLLGNRYNITDRRAVRRCANAAVDEAWREFAPRRGDRRGRDWRNRPQVHVTAITDVDRRSTGLRVRGEMDSGLLYARPDRYRARVGDLRFRCNIDYNGRILDVRVDRNPNFRPPRPY